MTNDFRGVFALHYKGGHTDGYWYLVQYSKRGSNAYNVIARSHNCNADPTKQANPSQTLRSTWEFQARELDPYRGQQRGEGVGSLERMPNPVHFDETQNWVQSNVKVQAQPQRHHREYFRRAANELAFPNILDDLDKLENGEPA